MVVGPTGSGKSTLLAALGRARPARKTEAIEVGEEAIDTPGEFFNIPWYYRILIQTSCKADVVLLVMDAKSKGGYPPQFGAALRAPVVGAVTKADLATPSEIESARVRLVRAGAREVRIVSATAGTGVQELEAAIVTLARRFGRSPRGR
jgi:ethanolamine utilization protein EutP